MQVRLAGGVLMSGSEATTAELSYCSYQCTLWEETCASQPLPGDSWQWTSHRQCCLSPSYPPPLSRSRAAAFEAFSLGRHRVGGHLEAWTGCLPAKQEMETPCWWPEEGLLLGGSTHTPMSTLEGVTWFPEEQLWRQCGLTGTEVSYGPDSMSHILIEAGTVNCFLSLTGHCVQTKVNTNLK